MDAPAIITALVALIGVLTVGVAVPAYLLNRAARERREDAAQADRRHREDRDAEWERQDKVAAAAAQAAADMAAAQKTIADQQRAVAAQAAEAARLLLAKQEETAAAQQEVARQAAVAADLLAANNAKVAEVQQETNSKLDVIHTLVNSNMTAAMQSEFDAVKRELAVMRELMELKRAAGQEPTPETIAAIGATEAKLNELDATLADRKKAQDQVSKAEGVDVITTTTYRDRAAGDDA